MFGLILKSLKYFFNNFCYNLLFIDFFYITLTHIPNPFTSQEIKNIKQTEAYKMIQKT